VTSFAEGFGGCKTDAIARSSNENTDHPDCVVFRRSSCERVGELQRAGSPQY
jgi:hypothetical protein